MSLLDVRKEFIEFSGRYDLVRDPYENDWHDMGANKFIYAGQRWLDRTFETVKTYARWFGTIAIGTWYVIVPELRVPQEVWMSLSAEGHKWKLCPDDLNDIRRCFATDPATIDNGMPGRWAPASIRVVPEVSGEITIDMFGSVIYTVDGDHFSNNGIVWMAPTDRETTVEVFGKFYQPRLVNDADENYWSSEESLILAMAACRALEHSYRNIQGVNDWTNSIRGEMLGLEFDLVDQETINVKQMEG